jgi:hypothetical protein
VVVAGNGATPNKEGLSGMMYAWGQFIDHDINLTLSDGVNPIDIVVPSGDPVLSGSISMTRSVIDPLTGVAGKPATTINNVTGWIDGSMVYGSDATTAASLRDANGYLLTSAGNNLPIVNGAFVAGDFRVSENPNLTALQTLFLREHNRQVDKLKLAHPDWSGNQLYDQARAIVSAEIARITYNEFLPHLLGPNAIKAYQGYKAGVDARLSEEFAGAAFRFGHSIVSTNLEKIDEQGNEIGMAVTLKEAFSRPLPISWRTVGPMACYATSAATSPMPSMCTSWMICAISSLALRRAWIWRRSTSSGAGTWAWAP